MTTVEDPQHDSFLQTWAHTRRFMSGRPGSFRFTPDGQALLFLRSGPTSAVQTLFSQSLTTGEITEVLTAERVLDGASEALSEEEKARLERLRSSARGIISYQLSRDGQKVATTVSGRLYLLDRTTGTVTSLRTGEGAPIDPRFSPDGGAIAYVRAGDLYVLDLATNSERRLTTDGGGAVTNGLAEFIAQEEMHRYVGYWWSPDSSAIAYVRADSSKVEPFAIVDPTHPEKGASVFPYPRPGRANAEVRLGVVPVAGGETTWVDWDHETFPYLATVRWPKHGPLNLLVQNRLQTRQQLLAWEEATRRTRVLLEETDEAWLNLNQDFPHWLEGGAGFLWFTERNGGPEIERRSASGALEASLVPPHEGFDAFVGFDQKTGWLYFTGSPNPTESVLKRVKAGAPVERVVTDESGPAMQSAALSRDGRHLVVITSSLRQLPRAAIWRTDGVKVADVPSLAQEPDALPTTEIREVTVPGHVLPFHAAVIRPRNFESGRRYPVVLQVYGGPHHLEVKHSAREDLLLQWLADQGFVVVKTDNRGTTHRRGRDWERAILHDLGGVPMDDQVAVLRQLAKELPELDLTRVGIQGWSYGGYMAALGVLRHPELFRVAVAGAPVVDWRDYDTHYTERYMGLPDEQSAAYDRASLLTHASRLTGSLLLVHGTGDDNVYFFHTLKLSDALFRAGRRHDVLPLSDFTHMVADPLVTERLNQRTAQQLKDVLLRGD